MCTKADNSCREEKRGCKGCYYSDFIYSYAELLNKMYEYKISKTDKEKMLKILLKIIQNNYYCKFNEIIIRDNEFLLEIQFSNLTINVGFNLEHLLRTEFNKNYIIYNIDNVILNYYKIEK